MSIALGIIGGVVGIGGNIIGGYAENSYYKEIVSKNFFLQASESRS
jgi:hypothetical protein